MNKGNIFQKMRGVTCGIIPSNGHLYVLWEDFADRPLGRRPFEWGNGIVLETSSIKDAKTASPVRIEPDGSEGLEPSIGG